MVTAAGLATFGSIFATTAGAATAAAYIGAIVVNLAISALLGKILAPDLPTSIYDTKGFQTLVKSNVLPRRICYGEAIIGGPYALLESIGTTNEELRMIIVLTTHPIEDVLGVFLDDEYIDISGTGGATNDSGNDLSSSYYVNTGPYGYNQSVRIIKNLGWGYAGSEYVTDELSFQPTLDDIARMSLVGTELTTSWNPPVIGTRNPSTGQYGPGHKLTNCSSVYLNFKHDTSIFSGFPTVKFHIKGKRLYDPSLDSSLVAYGADSAGTHSRTNGETWEWSENWALCCLDYILDTRYGLAARTTDTVADPTEIDWAEFIQATQDAAELVINGYPSPDVAMVPRYTVNGVFETSSTPISHMEALLTSGAGQLIYSQGQYKLRAGVYKAPADPTDIINEDMIVSPMVIRTHTPRSNIFNKAGGTFVDKGYDDTLAISTDNKPKFEPSDFPIVDPLSGGLNPYEVIDGEEIIIELDYPFTTYAHEAQRLSRIQLERIRQGLTIQFESTLEVLKYSVGDNIYLEILNNVKYANEAFFNRLGLDDEVQNRPDSPGTPYYKQFKIVEMSYTEDFNIAVTLIEESEEIYEWNDGDANLIDYKLGSDIIIDDPSDTVLPPSFVVPSPTAPINEYNSWPNTSTVVTWTAPDRGATVNAIDQAQIASYTLEYGIVTNISAAGADRVDSWIFGGTTIANPSASLQGPISLENLFVDDITDFEFRIRANTFTGRVSAWAYYSDDIGSYFSPSIPPSAQVSTPVAGVQRIIYNTQVTSFDSAVGTNPGEWAVYDNPGTPTFTTRLDQIDRIYLNTKDAADNDITTYMATMRTGDTITLYISSNRWYKYKIDNPNFKALEVATNTLTSPTVEGDAVTFYIPVSEIVDFKDTDASNTTAVVANMEFRIERDAIAPDLNTQLDTNFSQSTYFENANGGNNSASSAKAFWSITNVNSPSSADYLPNGGETGGTALQLNIDSNSPTGLAYINSRVWFENPYNNNLVFSMRYQSLSGSDPDNVSASSPFLLRLFGDPYPDSDAVDVQGNTRLFFPPTGSGNWKTVTMSLNLPAASRFMTFRIELTHSIGGAASPIDLLIDSFDLRFGTKTQITEAATATVGEFASNEAYIYLAESNYHVMDLTPATGNVTATIQCEHLLANEIAQLDVRVIQDSTARTVTWLGFRGGGSAIDWEGGTAPTVSTGSGAVDIFTFKTHNGGTNWTGSALQNVS